MPKREIDEEMRTLQLERMIKFIEHDGNEVAMLIHDETELMYSEEIKNLIRVGMNEVNLSYNKRIKLETRKTATIMSNLMTGAKLEILRRRDQHIKSVMADIHEELTKLRDNVILYKRVLRNLILQALYKILEKEVYLMLIPDDVQYVKPIIHDLEQTYRQKTGLNVKINIECCLVLPMREIGGVIVTARDGSIIIENTLVVRLIYLVHQAIPIIRSGLFGPNPNRTHSNIDL